MKDVLNRHTRWGEAGIDCLFCLSGLVWESILRRQSQASVKAWHRKGPGSFTPRLPTGELLPFCRWHSGWSEEDVRLGSPGKMSGLFSYIIWEMSYLVLNVYGAGLRSCGCSAGETKSKW